MKWLQTIVHYKWINIYINLGWSKNTFLWIVHLSTRLRFLYEEKKKYLARHTSEWAFHTNGHHTNKEIRVSFIPASSAHSLCLIPSNAHCEAGTWQGLIDSSHFITPSLSKTTKQVCSKIILVEALKRTAQAKSQMSEWTEKCFTYWPGSKSFLNINSCLQLKLKPFQSWNNT